MLYLPFMAQEIDPTLAKVAAGTFVSKEEAAETFFEVATDQEVELKQLRADLIEAEKEHARGESIPGEEISKRFRRK